MRERIFRHSGIFFLDAWQVASGGTIRSSGRMKTFLAIFFCALFSIAPAAPEGATKDVTPDEAEALLKGASKPLVLDVRTPEEFAKGHIPGAKNVDFFEDDFEKRVAALAESGPVIVHCAAGGRSAQALPKIAALKKFGTIYHLKAGFSGWASAKKAVEGGK